MSRDNDNKSVDSVALKAGAWYVVSSILVKTIAVISTPIFTRLMTTEEYGISATFISWYSLLLTFFTLNLTYSIGRAKLDFPNELDKYIGSVQLFSGIISTIFILIGLLFIKPLTLLLNLNISQIILLMLHLLFAPSIQFAQNGYRYSYKYKQNIAIAWYTSISTVALSLILILYVPGNKATLRALGIVIPNCMLSVYFWFESIKNKNISINEEHWKYGITLSAPLILHTISINILSQSDRVFIAKYIGSKEVGIYSLVYSYGIVISVVTNAISDGWLPWFHDNFYAGNYEAIKINSKKIVILGCFLGLACIAFAPEAIYILGGKKYLTGLPCVLPVVLGIVCQYVYTHYVNIEMNLKKTKYVSYGTMFAAALNVILNIIFIPVYGFVAAAYTTLTSYLFLMIAHFCISKYLLRIKLYDDLFMFGALITTSLISILIVCTYNYDISRCFLVFIGFCCFLYVYRGYIILCVKKFF